jgi:asparagine synthase (glutamine-hydrolysing)
MCGIFGVLGDVPTLDMSEDVISSCLDTIAHRGPDARGIAKFSSEHSSGFLGHVRLSIIDLSGGQQPMASDDSNVLLSFNGEIYNYLILKDELLEKGYHFRGSSDTEVLLNAYREWGVDCLGKLRGMFAFAIWDAVKGSLIIARDQFGKKPIFYTEKNGLFFFASEIKALQAIPNTTYSLNKAQLKNYLICRYVPSPETFINEIKKLPAGSYMECRNGEKTIVSFFKPAEAAPARNLLDRPSAVSQFLQILDESVRLRMAADVPYGAFLSGGIDSSAIVALMSEHSSKTVKTFSVGFNNTEYSELGYARVIAKHFSTDHHEVVISQDDLIELLPEVIAYRDAPVCEPSDIPIYLLAMATWSFMIYLMPGILRK